VKQARKLIDDGTVDVDTEWSDAAPSADLLVQLDAKRS
jgi:hypothetical protein